MRLIDSSKTGRTFALMKKCALIRKVRLTTRVYGIACEPMVLRIQIDKFKFRNKYSSPSYPAIIWLPYSRKLSSILNFRGLPVNRENIIPRKFPDCPTLSISAGSSRFCRRSPASRLDRRRDNSDPACPQALLHCYLIVQYRHTNVPRSAARWQHYNGRGDVSSARANAALGAIIVDSTVLLYYLYAIIF